MGGDGDPIRVLHVDDEPEFVDVTADFLEREDERLTVVSATDATEGLDRLADSSFDCIISDYEMPGQNGIAFLESVREDHPDLPFILYTGKGSEEVAADAISAGVTDYLQKEYGTDQYAVLANRITNAVESYRSKQTLAERNEELRQYEYLVNTMPESAGIYDEEGRFVLANESLAELYDTSRAALEGEPSRLIADVRGNSGEDDPYQALLEGRREQVVGEFTPALPGAEDLTVEYRLVPLRIEGSIRGVVGVSRDVTDRRHREEAIEELHSTAQTLMQAETPADIAHVTVDALADILDMPCNGIFLYDETAEKLVPAAWSDRTEDIIGKPPTFSPGEAIAWDVYETGESLIHDDVTMDPDRYNPETNIRSEITLPLGNHGVVLIGSPQAAAFDETDVDLARTLATHTETALDRVEREGNLRRYRTLVETVGDPMYILDATGSIQMVNDAAVTYLDTDEESLLGTNIGDLIADEDYEAGVDLIDDLRTDPDRQWATHEVTGVTDSGDRFAAEMNLAILTDSAGEFSGSVGVMRDMTDRKADEKELEMLRERLEFVLDVTESHIWASEIQSGDSEIYGSTEPMYGAPVEEIQRTESFYEYVHPDDRYGVRRAYEQVWSGEQDRFDIEFRTNPDRGEVRWLASQARYREEHDADRLVGLTIDVTDRKRREQKLEEFAGIVSHDLRSPLNVAQGRLALVRDECDDENLDRVARAHGRMDALIEDLLTLAREGEATMDREPVSLADCSRACWKTVDTADATLVVDTDRVLDADRNQLQQLLENLFANAVDHCGDDVTVTVGALETGFYVGDDGPGIPPGEREVVFDAGYSTTEEGTGFGLSIVDQVVDAHGWEIHVTESSEGGARFEITGTESAPD